MTTYLLLIYYWITTDLLLNYVRTVLWTIRTSDPLIFMLDALANASRSRNKLRPRSPFSDEKNVGNRTSTGCTAWNSALCTCAHTHACRKNIACAFLAGFRVVCCLVLPVSRQKRPESLSGGARNGCYGKLGAWWLIPHILFSLVTYGQDIGKWIQQKKTGLMKLKCRLIYPRFRIW